MVIYRNIGRMARQMSTASISEGLCEYIDVFRALMHPCCINLACLQVSFASYVRVCLLLTLNYTCSASDAPWLRDYQQA